MSFASKRVMSVRLSGIRRLMRVAERMPDVISFALGEPDFDTPQHIKEAAINALRQGYTHYTSNYGLIELREAVSRKLEKENGIAADPSSEVLITTGAQESLYAICQAFVDPGDEVIVTDPCYHCYPYMIRLAGGTPIFVRLDEDKGFHLDMDRLEKGVSARTKLIVVTNPHNPTGAVLTAKDLSGLAEVAIKHNLLVVSDETYEKILYDNAKHVSVATLPGMESRTITVNSFSKTYAMTGWRVGYCSADKSLIEEIVKIHAYTVVCTDSIAQKAAVAALEGPQDCVADMVQEFWRRRDFVMKKLGEVGDVSCRTPRATFYAFINVSRIGKSSTELAEFLLKEAKIIIGPGSECGPASDRYLRLSFTTPIEKLGIGLDRFGRALARIKR